MRNVALLVTCLTDAHYPRVGEAVCKVLQRLGCHVAVPQEQTCCGRAFYDIGLHEDAADFARRTIEVFESFDYIVTPSASCCAMVRCHFPRLLEGQAAWKSGLEKLVARTYEFVEFLDRVLKVDLGLYRLPKPRVLALHYDCRLRELGIAPEGVHRVLGELNRARFVPMENADQCCGFAGALAEQHPAVSQAIADDKATWAIRSGAEILVCGEAGCATHLERALQRQGHAMQIRHPAELIAEALGLELSRP